jgi:hypothetical protein
MRFPIFRAALPVLLATCAFAQTPASGMAPVGDSLVPKHDTTVHAPKKRVVKFKQSKAVVPAEQLKPQSTCPVLGGPVDRSLYVDFQGKRIYVCCAGCIDAVKKDPALYIEKLRKAGQSVEVIDSGKGKHAPASAANPSDAKSGGTGSIKMP